MSTSTLGSVNVPKDATVHELTSNTIWFIENLLNHYDVIGVILQPDVLYATQLDTILMKKQLPEEERNKALLAIYISIHIVFRLQTAKIYVLLFYFRKSFS